MKIIETTAVVKQYQCDYCGKTYAHDYAVDSCERRCRIAAAEKAGAAAKYHKGDIVKAYGDYYTVFSSRPDIVRDKVTFRYDMKQVDDDGDRIHAYDDDLELVCTARDLQLAHDSLYEECLRAMPSLGTDFEVEFDFETGRLRASVYREVVANKSVTGRDVISDGSRVLVCPPDGETADFEAVVQSHRIYGANRIMYKISCPDGGVIETDEDHVDVIKK